MSGAVTLRLRDGGLYLSASVCDRHFAGIEAVILLRRDTDLAVLPVRHAAAGGYLLKRRNAAGDRVVFAPDFFRASGVADGIDRELVAHWNEAEAALVAPGVLQSSFA